MAISPIERQEPYYLLSWWGFPGRILNHIYDTKFLLLASKYLRTPISVWGALKVLLKILPHPLSRDPFPYASLMQTPSWKHGEGLGCGEEKEWPAEWPFPLFLLSLGWKLIQTSLCEGLTCPNPPVVVRTPSNSEQVWFTKNAPSSSPSCPSPKPCPLTENLGSVV